MSHEIRTPLNGVLGMTHLLAETDLNDHQRHYLDVLLRSGESLLHIINDILDYSKIEAGHLHIDEKPFNLNELVDSVLDLLGPKAASDGLAMVVTFADGLPLHWLGDENRLRQVLYNLIGNGIKFTREGGVNLSISAVQQNAGWMLHFSVEDTGIGISADAQATLFDRFTQADASTTREYGGTGLGLAICRQLVELMGGSIEVESILGRGSRFTFKVALKPAGDATIRGRSANRAAECSIVCPGEYRPDSAAIAVTSNTFLQHWFGAWLPEFAGHCQIVNSPEAAMQALADFGCLNAALPVSVIISWDIRHSHSIAALTEELSQHANISVGILAPPNFWAEPEAEQVLQGHTLLSMPATNVALRQFLSMDGEQRTANSNRVRAGSKIVALRRPAPAFSSGLKPGAVHFSPPQAISPSNVPRLLLVEDNQVNQTVALAMLGMAQRYHIDVAKDGYAALSRLTEQPYDLVLMDVQMPELDGLEATRRIRRMPSSIAALPIIGMTAHAFDEDRDQCLAAGMNDYISKPVNRALLLEKVSHWLAQGRLAAAPSG